MFSSIKQTLKHTSIFALGKISSKLVGFILLPIYTKEISVSDYGILGLLEMLDLFCINILAIGMPQALLRWYSLARESIERKKIVFTNFMFLLFIFLGTILFIVLFKTDVSDLLLDTSRYDRLVLYVFIAVSLSVLTSIPLTILRVEEKSVLFTLTVLAQFTASLILNIYFVAFKKMGIEGVLLANVISNSVSFLILFPYLLRRMTAQFDFSKLREMLIFGYPFIFASLFTTILSVGDRFILTKIFSHFQVGLYSLGYKVSNVLKIFVVDSFTLGLPIIAWKLVRENEQPKLYLSKIFTYLTFVLLWLGLIITFFSRKLIEVFALNPEYWEAYRVVPFVITGIIFLGMQQHLFFILQIPKKTLHISFIVGIAASVNIVSNILLIPDFQMMGAAYSTAISYFIATVLAYVAVQKYYPIKFEKRRLFILLLAALLYMILGIRLDNVSGVFILFMKAFLILIFPFILLPVRFYEPEEISKMKELISRLFSKRQN